MGVRSQSLGGQTSPLGALLEVRQKVLERVCRRARHRLIAWAVVHSKYVGVAR
jgi:hypothetical protein